MDLIGEHTEVEECESLLQNTLMSQLNGEMCTTLMKLDGMRYP